MSKNRKVEKSKNGQVAKLKRRKVDIKQSDESKWQATNTEQGQNVKNKQKL